MQLEAVIFDMDGVLADSKTPHYQAFHQLGVEMGIPFTWKHLEDTFGMHNDEIFPFWLNRILSKQEVNTLALRKEEIYRSLVQDSLQPIPGAVELVRKIQRAHIPLAVGSSGPRLNVELALKRLGLADAFAATVSGDDVAKGKPAPDIFLLAAKKLGIDNKKCLVFEDAVPGIEAAIAAGMKVIAIASTRKAQDLTRAHMVIEKFDEIQDIKKLSLFR